MELTTTQKIGGPPRPASQALDLALSIAHAAVEEAGELTESSLPSGARVGLQNRARVLDEALAPAPRDAILTVLASISGMPTKAEIDPAKVKAFLAIEVSDLMASRLPAWALEAAARANRLGEVGDGHWRPTAGDLASNARARVASHYRDRDRIARVLGAKLVAPSKAASAEQKKAVAEGLRALAAKMSA